MPAQRVATGRPQRRPTLADVARTAGVSPALVSMVLSGRPGPSAATAARIIEVADGMGYRPDRAASVLARRHTGQIGVTLTTSNPYHGTVVEEILGRAHDAGYEVVLSPMSPRYDYRESLETLVNSRCEALILLNPQMSGQAIAKLVAGTPTVCMGRALAGAAGVDVVRTDDAAALDLLVGHLHELGHRRIAHVDGGEQPLTAERAKGYSEAMVRRGLRPLVLTGGETPDQGAAAVAHFAGTLPFTAVIAFNDLAAVGILDQLMRNGFHVPDDVSVAGIDDDWITGVAAIDLTTVDPGPLEQARICVDLALERLTGERTRRVTRVVEPKLVVRASTAAPRS